MAAQKVVQGAGLLNNMTNHPGEIVTTILQKIDEYLTRTFSQSNVAEYVQPFGIMCIVWKCGLLYKQQNALSSYPKCCFADAHVWASTQIFGCDIGGETDCLALNTRPRAVFHAGM